MLEIAKVTKMIAAPPERVWAAIKSIGGLDRWFPIIETCRVEGEGEGAVRVLGLVGGGEMKDRILEISDADKRLRYHRFESPIPVNVYLGAVEVRGVSENRSELCWIVRMETSPERTQELQAFLPRVFKTDNLVAAIEGALSAGIDGMAQELRAASHA